MAHEHFLGEEAVEHLASVQASGLISSSEKHGYEPPGSFSAALDAVKEIAIGILLLNLFLSACHFKQFEIFWLSLLFTFSWSLYKGARSAWLGWSRLERMHRLLVEEKYEIEHNRKQERDELAVIYRLKGFKDKLLEEVLDVLMADEDRLLKIMVQEEMGLTLDKYEHPLKQGLGAFFGTLASGIFMLISYIISPIFGHYFAATLIIGFASALAARLDGNRLVTAVIWNLAISVLVFSTAYFLFSFFALQGWVP